MNVAEVRCKECGAVSTRSANHPAILFAPCAEVCAHAAGFLFECGGEVELRPDSDTRPAATPGPTGQDRLHTWWGLSYASWLALPRVLLQEMPDDWQRRLVDLLEEFDAAFPNLPVIETRVQTVTDGKLSKTPDWLIRYRHPDADLIESFKKPPSESKPCPGELLERWRSDVDACDTPPEVRDAVLLCADELEEALEEE